VTTATIALAQIALFLIGRGLDGAPMVVWPPPPLGGPYR
jgi:hypothetical protein